MSKSKNYKQYDTRWAKLGYPKAPWYIKDCGCGEVAIANSINKSEKYKDETPKTILPYCRQFAAPNGDGTRWDAPPIMMEHYGMTHVKEHSTMASLWKELEKGDRVAIYLMSNRNAGSQGIHWTGSKHFICSVAYKHEDGKHKVYIKDSNSDSEAKNGWHSYESVLRNAVFKVWSGKLPKSIQDKICDVAKEIADSGKYRYVNYSDKYGKECAVCHPHDGKNKGWNCIGYAFACWHHAGIPCRCKCDVITDQIYNELLRVSLKKAKRIVADRTGLDIDDIKVHRNGGKAIPFSRLKKGDIIVYYTSKGYVHTALYIGDGKIADCTSGRTPNIKYGVKSYKSMTIKFAISYVGK